MSHRWSQAYPGRQPIDIAPPEGAGRVRTHRFAATGPRVPLANPRPVASRTVADRAGLLAEVRERRRQAQIMARQALEAPETPLVEDALAS
jgi:hypothetical protein